eukprot:2284799-Prymnesium_polylepis.2
MEARLKRDWGPLDASAVQSTQPSAAVSRVPTSSRGNSFPLAPAALVRNSAKNAGQRSSGEDYRRGQVGPLPEHRLLE